MSDKQWRIFDDGDREFTGEYDVWIGTEGEDGSGSIVGACFRDHARLIAAAPDMLAACQAAVEYDIAIQSCANSPERMASFCTATGDDLDALYARWQSLTRAAIAKATGA